MEIIKIEIVIADVYLEDLIQRMEEVGVQGYTAIEISRGKGVKRGEQLSEGLLPTSQNLLVFAVVLKETADQLIEKIQPFLNERGGVIITSKVEYASGFSK
jgi:nitrogen regulatory protein PII